MFKEQFTDLKYFNWLIRNWFNLKGDKSSLITFLIYWTFYPIPRLLLGKEKAHKILPGIISKLKNKNLIIPLSTDRRNVYWIGLRDKVDFEIFREVCIEDHYNSSLIKPRMTVVDVGSHIGTFTLIASQKVGEKGKVITIEPEIHNFGQLKDNLKLNEINNCKEINVALADYNGEGTLFIKEKSCGHSLVSDDSPIGKTQVVVRTLDSLLKELNVNKVDFLKIDTEGAELEVLKGAREILLKNPRIKIVTECSPEQKAEMIEYLKNFKFSPKVFWSLVWA